MNNNIKSSIVLIGILLVVLLLQFPVINEFPQYIHCWAQSDRYALALGFLENGFDFFHPQTFVLNPQFPGNFLVPHSSAITAVDFPIYEYVVSFIMRLFNSTEPWCFRAFSLVYSAIGLWYLYKLSQLFTKLVLISLSVLLFALTSPVYWYYMSGFLPTIASLANTFIALYFYFSYRQSNSSWRFFLSLFFITIAALARLPFSIFLIAMICCETLQMLKNRKFVYSIVLSYSTALAVIGVYFLYNSHLRSIYGSMFLSQIMPATSQEEIIDFFLTIIEKWGFHYFTAIHYIILLALFVFYLVFLLTKRNTYQNGFNPLAAYTGIALLGCVGYFFLMEYQFINHDYYFLDTFFVVFILFFIFLSEKAVQLKNDMHQKITASMLCLCLIVSFVLSGKVQHERRELLIPEEVQTTAKCYEDAYELLEQLHVSSNAKILVLGGDGPNNAFLKIKRQGYSLLNANEETLPVALKWPFEYVIAQNSELKNTIYNQSPSIIYELVKVGGNDRISVYKKKKCPENNLTTFFGFNKTNQIYHTSVSFDSIPPNSTNADSLSSQAFSGEKSGVVVPENEYGFTHTIYNLKQTSLNGSDLFVKCAFAAKTLPLNEALLCVSIDEAGKNMYFNTVRLDLRIKDTLWNQQEFLFHLPPVSKTDSKISVFIWNVGKNTLIYDDFEISIY